MKLNNPVIIYKQIRLLSIVVLFVFFWAFSFSQVSLPRFQKLHDPLNQLGGSFQVVISPMVEDSLGYIWIGSKNGLCKYNGSGIQCFEHQRNDSLSIGSNDVENIFLDKNHHLWVALNAKGINVFDIHGQKIKEFIYDPNDEKGILANRVWGIFEDDAGYVWISYFSGGMSRYDEANDSFEHFTIDSAKFLEKYRAKTVVNAIPHSSEKHTFWLSTTGGLVKFNTATQQYQPFLFFSDFKPQLSEDQYNSTQLASHWSRCMTMDNEGILWIGTFGGMVRFDPRTESYKVFYDESKPLIKNVVGIHELNEQYLLLSQHTGLVLFDKNTFSYSNLSEQEGAPDNYYLAGRIYEAENGCIYLANAGGKNTGIYQFCEAYQFVEDYNTGHYVGTILATEHFVHYFNKPGNIDSRNIETGAVHSSSLGLKSSTTIKSMFALEGDNIIFTGFKGAYNYSPLSGISRIKDLEIEDTYRFESLLMDRDGDIWTGRQRDGIYRHLVGSNEVIHYNQSSDPALVYQDYIVSLLEDSDGDIWIATEQGWTIFDKKNNTTRNYNSDDIARRFAIDIKVIIDIEETSDGSFWIATESNGILKWDKEKEDLIRVFDMPSGMRNQEINDILVDQEDNLWVASDDALIRIDTKTDKLRNFGKEYGIDRSIYCMSQGGEGIIYAGHAKGYYTIDTWGLMATEEYVSQAIINGFKLFDKDNDALLGSNSTLELTHDNNFIGFEFGSLNYFNPEQEEYQYQLVGIDKDWIYANGAREKSYTDLRAGTYTFKVRLRTDGDWSTMAQQEIVISSAWYNTWWFRLISLLLIIVLLAKLIQYYIRNEKKSIEYEKNLAKLEIVILKSQMNPHFIFNSLNSIRYLFMKDDKPAGLKYITKFAKLLRETLNFGENAVINLSDEIKFTELFIDLEQLRFENMFTFNKKYDRDQSWNNIKILPFVIQPLVENAMWHGLGPSEKDKKILQLEIRKEGGNWIILIEDNGVGFNQGKSSKDQAVGKEKSYGLSLIKERFALANKTQDLYYSLEIRDSVTFDSGTLAIINITTKP